MYDIHTEKIVDQRSLCEHTLPHFFRLKLNLKLRRKLRPTLQRILIYVLSQFHWQKNKSTSV